MHCPNAKEKSNAIENAKLLDIVASAIMLASIGEEQGLDASAKKVPIRNGNINILPVLFCGIFFIIVGNCISINPTRFKPIIIIVDANNIIIIGDAIDVNALPVIEHRTPIMLNTSDNPSENEIIWINSFLLDSFEYPPTYPIIIGSIPKLQGDKEDKIPAKKAIISIIGNTKLFPAEYALKA